MITTELSLTVRYAETDQMGIVHHSNYPIWFEAGRTDFIRKNGMPYSKIEEEGVLLPLIELKCCFKGAAKYGDDVIVKTRIKELSYTRVVFYYEVYKSDAPNIITTGETMHAWATKELKPINIRKYMPHIYEMFKAVVE